MIRFVGNKLGRFALTILGASAIAFAVFYVVLDPVDLLLPVSATAEIREQLTEQLGLDKPLSVQYWDFLSNAVKGDFGDSISLRRPAMRVVLERLPATAILATGAMAVAVLFGIAIGTGAAANPGGRLDRLATGLAYGLISVHDAWISIVLILLFAVAAGWLPTGGYGSVKFLILPTIALATRPLGRVIQVTKTSIAEESTRAYVSTARSKGATPLRILTTHQLKSALPGITTFVMYDFGRLFVGTAIIVETVFAWPGIGSLIVRSLQSGDVFLSQAIVITAAVIVATLNLLADLFHMAIDPRVRKGS